MKIVGQSIKLSLFDDSDLALFVEISMCPEMMEHVGDYIYGLYKVAA